MNVRDLFPDATIIGRGIHPYGSREYMLVQSTIPEDAPTEHVVNHEGTKMHILAALRANRNVMFGAVSNVAALKIQEICQPLLEKALQDCNTTGEQPQALAALHGLCKYACSMIDLGGVEGPKQSETIKGIVEDNDWLTLQCVTSIASGIPRPDSTVVGPITHKNAGDGWYNFAKEFVKVGLADECELYKSAGAEFIDIELLADTNKDYMAQAGGAMARLFWVYADEFDQYQSYRKEKKES